MAKKDANRKVTSAKPPRAEPARGGESTEDPDDRLDMPTLLWALGILAVLILIQRLIWGE